MASAQPLAAGHPAEQYSQKLEPAAASGELIQLRPQGPWRCGSDSGARDETGRIFHSDSLYSAVCTAMLSLGWLEEWLDQTARAPNGSPVRLSSLFPAFDRHLLAPPPAHLWPPSSTSKLRASGARFIPVSLIGKISRSQPWNEDEWEVDGASQCLLHRGRRSGSGGPFRLAVRTRTAVDRTTHGAVAVHQAACLEFAAQASLWCLAWYASDDTRSRWAPRLHACFRLLGDTGIGGERSSGWGLFSLDNIQGGTLPELLFGAEPPPAADAELPAPAEQCHWLLALLSPAAEDQIDWSRGSYRILERRGRIESRAGWGELSKTIRMIGEGSVLLAPQAPRGIAADVAPDGFPHPVYRAGFGLSIELPWRPPA